MLWHGYNDGGPQRRYLTPSELRAFLIERVAEGYVFPLNPVWVLRDEGNRVEAFKQPLHRRFCPHAPCSHQPVA